MKNMNISLGPWTVGFFMVLSTLVVGIFNALLCVMFVTMDFAYVCYVLDEYRKNKNNKKKDEGLEEETKQNE